MKKNGVAIASVVLALTLLLGAAFAPALPAAFAATVVDSGVCGAEGDGGGLTWTLDGDGLLTIGGQGRMGDYSWDSAYYHGSYPAYSTAPWGGSAERCERIRRVVIESGVTGIGNSAFLGCTELTAATIPDSVTGIGDSAFSGCGGLTNATIPDGVTSVGSRAFSYCRGLTSATIPGGVTRLGSGAFYGCAGLTDVTIGNGVTAVGYQAFFRCAGLTDVTLPDSVTSVEGYAFYGCAKLKRVTVGNGVKDVGHHAFSGTAWYDDRPDGLVYVGKVAYFYKGTAPDGTEIAIEDGTKGIAADAFSGCAGLTGVTIPDSVTLVGESAFSGCAGLKSVTLPDGVRAIRKNAFSGCTALRDVVIGDGAKTVGDSVFAGCPIETLTLGKWIGTHTIKELGCDLSKLTAVTVAGSADAVAQDAFADCTALTELNAPEEQAAFTSVDGVLYDKERKTLIAYPAAKAGRTFVFPETVTAVAEYAFARNLELEEIRIPDRVRSLGTACFWRCRALKKVFVGGGSVALPDRFLANCEALESALIPDGVDRIGAEAFSGCGALTAVSLSNDVGMIGGNAFAGCGALDDVFYGGTANEWIAIGVKPGNEALTGARKHFGAMLPPRQVTGAAQTLAAPDSVTLRWKTVKGATEYRVYLFDEAAQEYKKVKTASEPPCVLDGLRPDTEYRIVIEAAAVTPEQTLTAERSDPVAVKTEALAALPGDADGNGEISAADARLALRCAVGLETFAPGGAAFLACDVNADGEVTAADARLILRAAVGLEELV